MEPEHLCYSLLTRSSSADARRLKSTHSIVPTTQQLISFSDNNSIRAAQWADHWWDAEWANNLKRLRIFIPETGTHPPKWPSQEEPRSGLTASAPVSDVSAPACKNGVWPPLQPVSVAQKTKLLTMLFSNVQSIDPPRTTRPDDSGRWDNRIAAQHMPRYRGGPAVDKRRTRSNERRRPSANHMWSKPNANAFFQVKLTRNYSSWFY